MHGIRSPRGHRTAVYYIFAITIIALLVFGAIELRGKLPAETYTPVGYLSDITKKIEAYQADGTLCMFAKNETSEKLVLDFDPPAYEIHFYMPQRVLDEKPNLLSLHIFCSGPRSFIYTLSVDKASYKRISNTEASDSQNFTYVNLGSWTLDSISGTLSLANLQVHKGLIIERGGNPDEDRMRIARTDADGSGEKENVISHVEIWDFAFVKEKEGRQPARPISLDYRFFMLASFCCVALFVLPLTFLRLKSSSLLLLLFIIGFLLRISVAPLACHPFDVLVWKRAARTFYENGSIALYTAWSGPPFWYFTIVNFYSPYALLKLLGFPDVRVYYQPILSIENTFLKLPLILSDILSAFLIYKICQSRNLKNNTSKMAMLAFLFNPFSIFISSIWCMYDSLAIFLALLGFYLCIKKRFYLCSLIWGLGVKWYTLGFIPFLSILAYLQDRKEGNSRIRRLMKSALIMCIGFGFFALLMIFPYILHGDLTYLKQIIEFRLNIGGGGGDVESLLNFKPASFGKILQDVTGLHPGPNFFMLTFFPVYLVTIVGFYFLLKRSISKENDAYKVFNNALIAVLFMYIMTYPQLNSQTVLWIVPHLILAHYRYNEFGVLPIVLTSLLGTTLFGNVPYFIVGFGIPGITIPGWLTDSLLFVFSASIVTLALYAIIKQLNPSLRSRICMICRNFLSRLRQVHLRVLYASTILFMFLQGVMFYYFKVQASLILSLLVLSVIIQGIAFFAMRSTTWKETSTKHQ